MQKRVTNAHGRLYSEDHEFLDYKAVQVHFIYGFLWKSSVALRPGLFLSGFQSKRTDAPAVNGWTSPFIHERVIGTLGSDPAEASGVGAYQPTFIMGRRCLETRGYLSNGDSKDPSEAWLLAPLKHGIALPRKGATPPKCQDIEVHPVRVAWTLRLFGSGSGTFTIRISLKGLDKVKNRAQRFLRIHRLLRLVPNIDIAPEAHRQDHKSLADPARPIVDAFLHTPVLGTFRLFDAMRFLRDFALGEIPLGLISDCATKDVVCPICAEEVGLAYQNHTVEARPPKQVRALPLRTYERFGYESWSENQSPFTFITVSLSSDSLRALRAPSTMRAKEFGSIYARLTLDSRFAHREFRRFTEEYLARALAFDKGSRLLPNFSHDEHLFFTFCRRGAIAVTASPYQFPALFVMPSLLNLFEIIRARLLAGLMISARLTEIAHRLAALDPESVPVDPSEYAHLRKLVVANLENPLEYLFDGGSATEMALYAEEALFVRRTWEDVRRSFDVVDRLMSAWETVRFRKRFGA